MADTALREFWSWFAANAPEVSRAYEEGDFEWLDDQLTRWLRSYADRLGWEIGPYHAPLNTLVISPCTREDLGLTRRLVCTAPEIDGWRFEPAKPRKIVSRLEVRLHGVKFSAENWTYRLTAYNDMEFVDLELFIPKVEIQDPSDTAHLRELVVEMVLGEELRLERVGRIQHSTVKRPDRISRATSIRHLYDHLSLLLKRSGKALPHSSKLDT